MTPKRKLSLLFAEDEPDARGLLEQIIRHKFPELRVLVAADGLEGLSLYEEHRPDLVLTDIMMPHLDGVEMAKRIRAIDPGAVIIAITAYNSAECDPHRFDACVSKPVEFAKLLHVVGTSLATLTRKGTP